MKFPATILLCSLLSLISCGESHVDVEVANNSGIDLGIRTIELQASEVLKKLDSKGFFITDDKGEEIPSQLTNDSLIIFSCELGVEESCIYRIHKADSVKKYNPTVWGQFYPKRRDDLSYENELVGFRIYGPGTRKAGEKSFGYDLFFKYPTEELIVPQLYAPETDDAVWVRVDSLRSIDNKLAEEYINSFSYHMDHGQGMDCYAVGPTLGAGVAAIFENDSIIYPWCYRVAEILDNGPIRFTAVLEFPSEDKGTQTGVTEYRKIKLDSYSFLNDCEVRFEGLKEGVDLVVGFPLRDETEPYIDVERGILAYADPTQGLNNGKALLGVVCNSPAESYFIKDNHILLSYRIDPKETFKYKWGFSWNKTEIPTLEEWEQYLKNSDLHYTVTIK